MGLLLLNDVLLVVDDVFELFVLGGAGGRSLLGRKMYKWMSD